MPSRRGLPTLSIFSRHSAPPSTSSSQTSPKRTSLPPLTPPARLHLRNLLPTSPEGMPTPPLPPRQPYSWLWQCHSCNTVYRIGCTRRCLVCSHEYCVSAGPPKVTRGKKRRRPSGMCASEFDYSGWAEWGAWRRKVLGLELPGRAGERQREQAFSNKTHNCAVDCDYPSECHHERYRVHTEALERRMLEESEELEEPHSPSIDTRRTLNTDDKLPLNEAVEVSSTHDDLEEQKSPTSPKSPLSQTSFFWDEPEAKGAEEKAWWVESETKEKKKRKTKSQQKIEQLTGLGIILEETGEPLDPEALQSLIDEDNSMMPLDVVSETSSRRCQSRLSCREHVRHRRKLTVRNRAEVEEWEDWEDSSDSESGDSSLLSPPSSCSSLDSEWPPTNGATSIREMSGEGSDDEEKDDLEKEIEKEMDALVRSGKSFLRD
ncbi:uncharacterized protein GGS22DRAFT_162802 [Annulohypoxylon maeteangense]|uniref:uncharacterized protein n=1 Tax=Annulohypoxylon maeteangense TaxID=1927788 RepID=UPI0020086529|nr:uncharacterized protein GGS22DRAFT_162802 [Annulohypoxylon maeteangense]KAI0885113.1 hypothetical protein GGS22DRAFT_162802 [Annulohypoxylon maeteangense]